MSTQPKPSRPNVLSDPQSLAALQARLRQRAEVATAAPPPSVPVYELSAGNASAVGAGAAADGTNVSAPAGGGADVTPLMYSGFQHSRANAASPSVIATASQSKSMRDRIFERAAGSMSRSPLPAGAISVASANVLKDTYAHEQAFPVQTVFEVQRMSNPLPEAERPLSESAPALKQSDTILTDGESAALIRTLERKLVEASEATDAAKAAQAAAEARAAELEADMANHDKTAADATTRLVESQAQCEAARQSIVTAVDAERTKIAAEFAAKEEETKSQYDAQIAGLTSDLERIRASISTKDTDQSSLFTLIADLQKACREGAEAKRRDADVIARLDRELQESRTRAATVSTGFHAKDKQVRDALGQVDTLQKDVAALTGVRGELEHSSEALVKLRGQYDEAMAELVPLRVVADEKAKLAHHCANLEADLAQKNEELGKLRGQVDVVRQQADAAYARSSNFRGAVDASQRVAGPGGDMSGMNMSGAPQGPSYASLPLGGGPGTSSNPGGNSPVPSPVPQGVNTSAASASQGPHADAMKQLRADIMAEDSRTEAERNKWKAGTN